MGIKVECDACGKTMAQADLHGKNVLEKNLVIMCPACTEQFKKEQRSLRNALDEKYSAAIDAHEAAFLKHKNRDQTPEERIVVETSLEEWAKELEPEKVQKIEDELDALFRN